VAAVPLLAICAMLINGEIAMLAGYIAIWATDVNGDNPEAADSIVDNDTPDNADDNAGPAADNIDVTCEPNDAASVPSCDTQPVNPVILIGGKLNCAIVEATDVAPA
jgi:hypothetical protein